MRIIVRHKRNSNIHGVDKSKFFLLIVRLNGPHFALLFRHLKRVFFFFCNERYCVLFLYSSCILVKHYYHLNKLLIIFIIKHIDRLLKRICNKMTFFVIFGKNISSTPIVILEFISCDEKLHKKLLFFHEKRKICT